MNNSARRVVLAFVMALLAVGAALPAAAQAVFINEIHYDNNGTDAGEAIEVAGPAGTNLTGWSLVLYNGTGGAVYNTTALSGTIPDQSGNGYGTLSFSYPVNGIQNGSPDGVALVNSTPALVQFLCYEGTFAAVGGAANGVTCTDIGVSEAGTEAAGQSLRLTGAGTVYTNFTWNSPATASFGAINQGQTFGAGDAAPSVSSTVPTNLAANVALGTAPTVTFSEPVNAAAGAFTLECPVGTPITLVVSGGPSTFTLTPSASLPPATTCTGTVVAANITDQDLVDPPDTMAANYVWTFGTASATPTLSINDVTVTEGNASTITATFTVSLTAPAGIGGVAFDIATADNTATTADSDYVLNSLTGQTIAQGNSTYTFDVVVNGDTNFEANETFFVNLTNITATGPNVPNVSDGQGQGTITNDDVTLTPIHDIQGPGASSPLSGVVTTTGIVTGRRSNGFFIQAPVASVDADPLTSEGILVFTSAAPPAAAAVGNLVQVTGTISEFVPGADPQQPPVTELTSPTVVQLSTGNPLPAPIVLTATNPDPAGSYDQLERYEGMRVTVPSLTVVAPTLGTVSEPNATATSSGVFYGVVTGVARPFREAGIRPPDVAPSGTIPPIPRWDGNPEIIRVDSDAIGAATLDLGTGAVVTNVTGPLDYTFRYYTILPDSTPPASGGPTPTAVTTPLGSEFTVASYNLERFFDTTDDPGISDVALSPTAFANRLAKASLSIRDFLKTPDILGVVEVENLTTLQALATKINNDAVAAAQPNPLYVASLFEGNDPGGIDVGFLVKTSIVSGSTPRVTVNSVTQEGAATTYINPNNGQPELLNDRPPLRLDAVVNHANGTTFPVTVIVNHLRSLSGIDDPVDGNRIRTKRLAQAAFLANLVEARQVANPAERIVLVGDFNAFDVNDGYVHPMATIAGTPVPDNETVVSGDGADLVTTDLVNLVDTPPAGARYGYIFDGSAQNIDHVLVNDDVVSGTLARRIEHPRVNADFPETARNNTTDAVRLSDHDPIVAFFRVAAFATADLAVTKVDTPDPVNAGANLTYTITVTNNGPDAAATASFSDTLPAGTTFVSLPGVAGWACTTPAVGAGGTVSCSNPSFAVGSAVFTLTVAVAPGAGAGSVLSNTATATSATADTAAGNNSATATTTVATSADLSVTKLDTPDPVTAGTNLTYTVTVANAGPSDAASISLSDTLPAGTTFVSLASPVGWGCTTPAVGAAGTVSCSIATLNAGSAVFTLTVAVGNGVAGGTVLSNTATVASATSDPNPGNNSGTATTSVNASSGVSIGVVASPEPVAPGGALTWTVTLSNLGPSAAANVAWSDPLPAGTTFTSLASAAGWGCTQPAAGANGTVSCSVASFPIGTATFTIAGAVAPATPLGTVLTNTASITAVTGDTDPGDNTSTSTTNVRSPGALAATKTASGSLIPGGAVTYTIVLQNTAATAQADNPGNELVDVLPSSLVLVSASATSGTAVATVATNTVTWNGTIPAGGTVTITVSASIPLNTVVGASVSNQATVSYDLDGDGTNESSGVSDDPATGAAGDPTAFAVGSAGVAVIPALGGAGLGLLALLVALGGALLIGRRLS